MDKKYSIEEIKQILRHKKRGLLSNVKVMDYLVIICIVTVISFVGISLYYYYKEGVPPAAELMRYFFAFFGGELLAMASITITKNIWKDKRKGDNNNDEY